MRMKCCVPLGSRVLKGKVKLQPDVARHCSNGVPSVSGEDYERGFHDGYTVLFSPLNVSRFCFEEKKTEQGTYM